MNRDEAINTPFHLPLSVIITSYNRAHLLTRAFSLILQTEKDWEAIIIDDGNR